MGSPIEVGPYEYTLSGVESAQGPNYQTSIAYVEVTKDGVAIATLTPERRWYPVRTQTDHRSRYRHPLARGFLCGAGRSEWQECLCHPLLLQSRGSLDVVWGGVDHLVGPDVT